MRRSHHLCIVAIVVLCGASPPLAAKVSPDQAARLGMPDAQTELTPTGAIRAGNADGSIPAWTGGITTPPPGYVAGGWYVDPYANDEVLFTITAQNYQQYADKLTLGTKALFERYPDTFKMHVYPTHRSASYPAWYYAGSIHNATHAEFCPNADPTMAERCLIRDSFKPGVFFPIPKTGGEAIWNHTYYYYGPSFVADSYGFNAYADGGYADHLKIDRQAMLYVWEEAQRPKDPYFERTNGAMWCISQEDIYPPRTAGQMFGGCNFFGDNDFDAYLYVPGQRRVRKAPEIGFYDSPGTGSDGLRTADQRFLWAITGTEEWYEYEPPKREEYYVPYNSYRLSQPGITFDDVAAAGHINQDIKRYELHRTWVIEGRVRPQFRHLGPHRIVYVDEDSWAATNADMFDAKDNLWRVSEAYLMNFYDQKLVHWWGDSHMDILSGRYAAVNAWHNIGSDRGSSPPDFVNPPSMDYFTPAGLRRLGIR